MYKFDKKYISERASRHGFVRDTMEKVFRLVDILEYINQEPKLKNKLALKGGSAINIAIFNLPRLSVDIDLDYMINNSREEMLKNRDEINSVIMNYMKINGYINSPKTKSPFSLDSFVFEYTNLGGNKDNIKIEINYSLRSHIFSGQEMTVASDYFDNEYKIYCLNYLELFGSKINALLNRAAARDLYDIYNMIRFMLFDENEQLILKKCVIFYAALSSKEINKSFLSNKIDSITKYKIKTDLLPVLTKRDSFNLENAVKLVKEFILNLMTFTPEEIEFIEHFKAKVYKPDLLFDDLTIIERIRNHPMILWKIRYI